MCELFFKVNQISNKNDPYRGWELEFDLKGDCQEVQNAIKNKNIKIEIGTELWSMSANISERQKQFSPEGFLWYIKGFDFIAKSKYKYKNITHGTMHYSHDFIGALLLKYPSIKNQVHTGHYSFEQNCIYIDQL